MSSFFALFAYTRIVHKIELDERLLLALQANEVLEEMRQHPTDLDALTDSIDQHVDIAKHDLELGIATFDGHGAPRVARGVLQEQSIPLPEDALNGHPGPWDYHADLGREHLFEVTVVRGPEGVVQVAMSARRFVASVKSIRNIFAFALPLVLLASAGAAFLLARGSLRPIAQITATARHITGSNLNQRIPTTGTGDELDQLAAR